MPNQILCLFVLLSSLSFGQEDLVRQWTKDLCLPEMHGRGYVNDGDGKAAEYLKKEYEKLGLTPVPGQQSFLQPFAFPVNSFPGKMNVSLNGMELNPGEDFIVSPSSGSHRGDLNYVVINKSNFQTEIQKKTANAIVLDKTGITGDSLTALNEAVEAWKKAYPIVELFSKKFTWSVATAQTPFPYIFLRDSLFKENTIYVDIENQFFDRHVAKNVVAYLPAKKKTKETIYFTAHYDHLGRMGENTYFPGANDNASGTAMLLALAKHFKANPPKYNLVFISFAGEEAGLIGSRYYVENALTDLRDVKFLVNLDIMGSGEEGITVVNATLFPKAFKKLTKINKKKDLLARVKSRGPAANSDHYFFTEVGVPAVFIYTQGPNKNYHDIFDTYDQLSFAETNDLIELMKYFVRKI